MTVYPLGYGSTVVTLDALRARHEPNMHPEFARRLFAWLEHRGGSLGIGGGYRPPGTQPVRPGFAPEGRSFHGDQLFASGLVAYAAVDLVHLVPGGRHRSPTHPEVADADRFALHCFIRSEPWHVQPVEIRGHLTWTAAGRPDPADVALPTPTPTPAPPPTPPKGPTPMAKITVDLDTLRRGAKGPDVVRLQRLIRTADDGDFGPVTDRTLRTVQTELRIVVDGIAGPQTWRALLERVLPR